MRKLLGAETLASLVDGERAVEEGTDINTRASKAAPAWAGMDLEEGSVELHRVAICDGVPVFEAADAREVYWRRLPRGLWRGRGVGEAGIEAGARAVKDALGLGEGAPALGGVRRPGDPGKC
jgi:hypothetical protein